MTSARTHPTAISTGDGAHLTRGDLEDGASMEMALKLVSQGRW